MAATLALTGFFTSPLPASVPDDPNLCVVDVDHSSLTRDEHGAFPAGLFDDVHIYPGFPLPEITGSWLTPGTGARNAGTWTVDADLKFARFPEPVPHRGYDRYYDVESDSGRIVVADTTRILAADSGGTRFRVIPTPPGVTFSSRPYYVQRMGGTVFPTTQGLFLLRGERLQPLASSPPSGGIHALKDLPAERALVLTTGNEPTEALIRADDGTVTTLAQVPHDKWEPFVGIFPLPGKDGVLVARAHQMLSIEFLQDGNRFTVRQTKHHRLRSGVTDPYYVHFLDSIGTHLAYGRPVGFLELFGRHDLERFGSDGFEAVPGEPIPASDYAGINVTESPSRGLAVINAYTDSTASRPRVHRLLLYDGQQTSPLPGPRSYAYPLWPQVFDLPSIGKILIISGSRIFELTRERKLTEIPSPLTRREGTPVIAADMPASRAGILMDGGRIFSINEAGIVQHIRGGDGKSGMPGGPLEVIPQRNQMLFRSREEIHLIVDRRISGATVCDRN